MERLNPTHAEKILALKKNTYFQELGDEILEEIAEGMRLNRYLPGENLFWDNEPSAGLFTVHSGNVKLYKISPQGRELVIQTFTVGRTFNEVSVFDHGGNPVNVAALDDCKVWVIEPEVVRAALKKYPELAMAVISNLTKNLRMFVAKVEELSFYQVTHRLARLLEQLPVHLLEGDTSTRLTHDQIAARLGTVREVVGRSLRELERSGAIKVNRGRIRVIDAEILEAWSSNPYT